MDIFIRSVKYNEALSLTSNSFTGILYVTGIRVASVSNDGNGNTTIIKAYKGFEYNLGKARSYARTLPSIDGMKMDLEMCIDIQVDEIIKRQLKQEEDRNINKLCNKAIVYESSDGMLMQIKSKGFTIDQLLTMQSGREAILTLVKRLQADGHIVRNTNIDKIYN